MDSQSPQSSSSSSLPRSSPSLDWRNKNSKTFFMSPTAYRINNPHDALGADYIRQQPEYQMHKSADTTISPGHSASFVESECPGAWIECDSAYLERYKSGLFPYLYVFLYLRFLTSTPNRLVVVDVFSTAIAVRPLRTLKAQASAIAMEQILQTDRLFGKMHIIKCRSDNGWSIAQCTI